MKFKRFLSFLLAVLTLMSTIVISSGSGQLIFSDDFSTGFLPRNWITGSSCAYSWNKTLQCIQGYRDAVVLQSNYGTKYNMWWDKFYGKIDFKICDFDDYTSEHEGSTHKVSLWYRDRMDIPSGEQTGAIYVYSVEVETGIATLRKEHSWDYYDSHGVKQTASTNKVIASANIGQTIVKGNYAPYYELGWRITAGKIECFFEGKCIITAKVNTRDTKYGMFTKNSVDASVGSCRSAFLVWNEGNYVQLDNFEIWSPDYDPATGGGSSGGGDAGGENTTLSSPPSFAIEAMPLYEGESTITAKLTTTLPKDASGYELGRFALDLNYDPAVMSITEPPVWAVGGTTSGSSNNSGSSYTVNWTANIKENLFSPGKSLVATVKFTLLSPAEAGKTYSVDLSLNQNSGIASMVPLGSSTSEIIYTASQISLSGSSVTAKANAASSGNAGDVYLNENFNSMEDFTSKFVAGAFYVDNNLLYGYSEAKALQSKYLTNSEGFFDNSGYTWLTYDASITLSIADDDLDDGDRFINLVYANDNPAYYGQVEDRIMMSFTYDIDERCFRFSKGWNNRTAEDQILPPVYMELPTEGEEFITLGISVDKGRIRCFCNDLLIFDFIDTANTYLIADAVNSCFLFWQNGNFIQVSNITVAKQNYIYGGVHESGGSDIPGGSTDTEINLGDKTVGFSLKPKQLYEGDTTLTAELCVTLPEDATGYELGSFGLNVSYDPAHMALAKGATWSVKGTTVASQNVTDIPYRLIWLSVKDTEQFGAGTTAAATLTFNLASPAVPGESYTVDLAVNANDGVASMESTDGVYKEFVYPEDRILVKGASVKVKSGSAPEVPDEPETPDTPDTPDISDLIVDIGDKSVGFSLVTEPVKAGDKTVTANLLVTLPKDATGYELGSFGLEVGYDFGDMAVAKEPEWHVSGTTMQSENLFNNPYKLMWISVNPAHQFKAGTTVAATITFDLTYAAEAGREYVFTLAVDADNGVASMPSSNGAHKETAYSAEQLHITGAVAVVGGGIGGDVEIGGGAGVPDVDLNGKSVGFTIAADPVKEGDTTLTAKLYVTLPDDATGYELGHFGLDMNYDPSVMTLAGEPVWHTRGSFMNSESIHDNPYVFLWISVDPAHQFKAGTTLVSTVTFNLTVPAANGREYAIDLAVNEDNGVWSMESKGGTYAEVQYSDSQIYVSGCTAVAGENEGGTGTPEINIGSKAVGFSLVTDPVKAGDTTLRTKLYVTLPEGATGYELGAFGLDVSYDPSVMTLASDVVWYTNGTTVTSEDLTCNPYFLLWLSINPADQFKAGSTLAATMFFDLKAPAVSGNEYTVDLAVNEEYGAWSMESKDGTYDETQHSPNSLYVRGVTVIADDSSVTPDVPDVPEVELGDKTVGFHLVTDPVKVGDTTLTAKLCVTLPEDATGYELGSFGLDVSYDPARMTLAKGVTWNVKGTTVTSKNITDIPYRLIWLSVKNTEQFSSGTTVAATLTFNLAVPAVPDETYTIDLAVNANDSVASMESKDGVYKEFVYPDERVLTKGASVKVKNENAPEEPDVPVVPDEPTNTPEAGLGDKDVGFYIVTDPVKADDTTVTAKLYATLPESANGYDLGSFGLDVYYDSSVMTLADEAIWVVNGNTITSDDLNANPYFMLWLSIKATEQFSTGTTHVATLTFDLKSPAKADDSYPVHIAVNEDNGVWSMASKDGAYVEMQYADSQILVGSATAMDAPMHTLELRSGKAPTCTEDGWKDYFICTECDFTTYETIPATGHDLVHHSYKLPTCSEIGYPAWDECTKCDYNTYVELKPTGVHEMISCESKAPTCTENGHEAYEYCENCDYCSTIVTIPATGHLNTTITGKTDVTCTENGHTGDTICIDCGDVVTYGEVIPAKGHGNTVITGKTDATCTENGYTGDTICTDCGDVVTYGKLIPAKGHGNTVITGKTDATCTENGYTGDTICTDCGTVILSGETIPATGHVNTVVLGKTESGKFTEGYSGDVYCITCGALVTKGEVIPSQYPDFTVKNGVLTKYTGNDSEVVIPSGITEIGTSAFAFCDSVTKVTIPTGVTTIGKAAFAFCNNLETVTLPTTLTVIGENAFASCPVLSTIYIPRNLESVGDGAFASCSSITELIFPASVTDIGDSAFKNCTGLQTVIIRGDYTEIGSGAFDGCTALTLRCYKNSETHVYAEANGVNYRLIVSGDTDDNGYIDLDDLVYLTKITNGSKIKAYPGCDVDRTGEIDLDDLVALTKIVNTGKL